MKPQYYTTEIHWLASYIREGGGPYKDDITGSIREAYKWVREGKAKLGPPLDDNDPGWIKDTPSAKKTAAFKLEVWKRKV